MLIDGFITFMKIGLFTLGGGYAMIPMIEDEVVNRHKWLSKEDFLDVLALAQMLPGIFAVNISIYIGHKLKGLKGSLAFCAGVVIPSFVLILLIAMFFTHYSDNALVISAFKGIRPAVVALILVPCIKLGKVANITVSNACFPICTAIAIWLLGISPAYIIILVAIMGFGYGKLKEKI